MSEAPRVIAVIQARMGSSRLPGKILLPLAGAPLLQRLVERVRGARSIDGLVVATTDTPADDAVEELCRTMSVACHRGSEPDVLGRILDAARARQAEIVVRLTADNPFVGGDLVDLVLDRFLAEFPDRVYAHTVDGAGFPYGLFVEAAAVEALDRAAREGDADDHEHVTLYLRRHPERFPSMRVDAPCRFAVDHLSIDTPAQYDDARRLFETLYRNDPDFGFAALAESAAREMHHCRT